MTSVGWCHGFCCSGGKTVGIRIRIWYGWGFLCGSVGCDRFVWCCSLVGVLVGGLVGGESRWILIRVLCVIVICHTYVEIGGSNMIIVYQHRWVCTIGWRW